MKSKIVCTVIKQLKANKYLIVSFVFFAIALYLIEDTVLTEIKDGDFLHYVNHVGSPPNDNPPLVYLLLGVFGIFFSPLESFLVGELFLYGALFITIYMVVVSVYGTHPIFSFYYFIFFYNVQKIFNGSPLKQILGLMLFFVFIGLFEHYKNNLILKHKLTLGFIGVLALLSHVIGFVLIIGFLLIYFLLKYFNEKTINISSLFKFGIVPASIFGLAFYMFKNYYFFCGLLKLGKIFQINFATISLNFARIINDYKLSFFVYFLIYAVSVVVNWKKINYLSLSILIVCSFFYFGATDGDYFFRFTSIVPLILLFGFCELFRNVPTNFTKTFQ